MECDWHRPRDWCAGCRHGGHCRRCSTFTTAHLIPGTPTRTRASSEMGEASRARRMGSTMLMRMSRHWSLCRVVVSTSRQSRVAIPASSLINNHIAFYGRLTRLVYAGIAKLDMYCACFECLAGGSFTLPTLRAQPLDTAQTWSSRDNTNCTV